MAFSLLPLLKAYCYTIANRTNGLINPAEYTTPPFPGQPPKGRSGLRPETTSLGKKRMLTGEQEEGRIQGLRILARIIARHYLEHPELYPAPRGDVDSEFGGVGNDDNTVNFLVRANGDAAYKEADQ